MGITILFFNYDFIKILRFICFHKKNERSQRLQRDKLALVSRVWDKVIENIRNYFKSGAYITVDEQLFLMKARCSCNICQTNLKNLA